MRRQFSLSKADEMYLTARGATWETVIEAGVQWVILHDFRVPIGYNLETVTFAILMVSGYPDAALDMAYFLPHLARSDGKPIPQLATHPLDGKVWQRWSRHRCPNVNPWIVGEDNLGTHVEYTKSWLKEEFTKRP